MTAAGPEVEDSSNMAAATVDSFFCDINVTDTAVGTSEGGSRDNASEAEDIVEKTTKRVATAASNF